MLATLEIRDMLIIDRLELGFRPGLNVLTGETGAGKSILLDCLGFVLGWRGRADLVRAGAERYAINAPIQGSAADLIKIAMIRIEEKLREKKTKLLLQVHDELVFDLHNDEEDLIDEIQTTMQRALPLDVPLIVDCGTGTNWLQAH